MKLVHLGAISTGIVIIMGIIMVVPAFTQTKHDIPKQTTLLFFSINDDHNIPSWCNDLSSILKKHNVQATVFVAGEVAEDHHECVKVLSNNSKIDIGSQTYHYVSLTSIEDYTVQLEEVRNGKQAVDDAGKVYSRLYKSPNGSTDDNIYSILSRTDIIADFSYSKEYNKYYDGKFIKFNLTSYDGAKYSPDFFYHIRVNDTPLIINFDNSISIEQIDNFISHLKSGNIRFVNASVLTGLDLTIREDEKA